MLVKSLIAIRVFLIELIDVPIEIKYKKIMLNTIVIVDWRMYIFPRFKYLYFYVCYRAIPIKWNSCRKNSDLHPYEVKKHSKSRITFLAENKKTFYCDGGANGKVTYSGGKNSSDGSISGHSCPCPIQLFNWSLNVRFLNIATQNHLIC